jgi:hypothetical protein
MKQNYYTARHFIMIPFEDENFITSYEDLCSKLKSENPEHFDPELLQKPSKLHISALIFDLKEDPVKVNKVCDIMKELQDDIKNIAEGEVTYKFGGYGVFDSYQKCRVIYSKMEEDTSYTKMEKIIDLIIKKLLKEGIILESQLNELHVVKTGSNVDPFYKIEMHLTLMNTTFLNKVLKKQKKKPIKNFDARKIDDCIKNEKLADCPLKKIDFCVLREDKSTGKYEVVQSFDLV